MTSAFFGQRLLEPVGPLVNSEYYPGWLTHWSESGFARVNSTQVAKTLEEQLKLNASVNFYMFHGGTNFGFTSGSYNSTILKLNQDENVLFLKPDLLNRLFVVPEHE